MDSIGKLIFNSLVSRRAVFLPCVGTFNTEFIPAADYGDGSVVPPRNTVVFTEGQEPGAVPVTDLIPQEPGGDSPSVQYDRWLSSATERGPVVIDGIGVVNNGIFTPYESLLNALNPIAASRTAAVKPTARKGLGKTEKIWLILIVLFIIILAGGWTWWHKYYTGPAKNPLRPKTEQTEAEPSPGTVTEEIIIIDAAEGQAIEVPEVEPASGTVGETASESRPRAVASGGSAGPGFYVVGGVFSVPGNADKYIREMSARFPDLDYVKHPFRGGQTLVSLYGAADWAEANRQRRRIEDRILEFDLWLYEVK